MQEFSKYKVITFGLVLMFVFVIAAIYANTKDIALQKSKTMPDSSTQQVNNTSTDTQSSMETELSDNTPAVVTENNNNNDLGNKILNLTERIDNIERTVFAPKNDNADSGVRCSVKGIINDGHFVPMSDSDALRESRENNKEVLITCTFK